MGRGLSRNHRLYLDHNSISDKGLCSLAEGIKQNQNLEMIHIWGNHFHQQAAEVGLTSVCIIGFYLINFYVSVRNQAFGLLTGGITRCIDIGQRHDKVSEKDMQFIRRVPSTKNYVRVTDILDSDKPKESKSGMARLKQENVDVAFYRLEGVAKAAAAY